MPSVTMLMDRDFERSRSFPQIDKLKFPFLTVLRVAQRLENAPFISAFLKNFNPHHPSEKYKVEVIIVAIEKVSPLNLSVQYLMLTLAPLWKP